MSFFDTMAREKGYVTGLTWFRTHPPFYERMATTYQETLQEQGIIFCAISEAVQKYPELVQKYLGSVVPYTDNFFAALNAAVFCGSRADECDIRYRQVIHSRL